MVNYTIRIDDNGIDTLQRLISFLKHDRYTKCLVYREVATVTKKLHYQGFVEMDESAVGCHKTMWSTSFKDHPGSKKSSAIVKKDEYLVYVTKDKDLVFSKGCTDDFINKLETQSYKKEKVLDTYTKFLNYCLESPEIHDKKYNINNIRRLLFRYLGSSDDIEVKRIEYYRSLCYKIQAKLLYGTSIDSDEYKSAEDRFCTAIS